MMRNDRWMTSVFATALLVGSTVLTASAFDEEKIKVSELPKRVLKAAKKAFPEAKVVGAAKETEDGDTIFEVMLTEDGKTIDLGINEEGEIVAVEKEIEVEDLPKAVTRAFAKNFPKGKVTKVEEVTDEDDVVVYELAIEVGAKEPVIVVMAPNGKILDPADDDEDEDDEEDDDDEDDDKKESKAKKTPKDGDA